METGSYRSRSFSSVLMLCALLVVGIALLGLGGGNRDVGEAAAADVTYLIVDTGQGNCYNSDGEAIACPAEGEAFYGQDAQYEGAPFAFQDNGDGTVTDLNTGLMWQVTPSAESFSYDEAGEYAENLELAGYDDWRLPSTKELFSISDFSEGWPYFDTDVFDIAGRSVSKDEQYWTESYVGLTHGGQVSAFGVNHGTGHIKSYPVDGRGNYVRVVRGETYGVNDFVDNGDGTVTDVATGLMWSQDDSGVGMDWEDALAYAEGSELAGYDDWRLPSVKELQSIVDYSKSPNAIDTDDLGPAIDTDFFNITALTSGTTAYDPDYGYFWTGTSAYQNARSPGYYYAWYVAFGTAPGPDGNDTHGAGAVRFAGKVEGGPDGEDAATVFNYVRLVRGGDVTETPDGNPDCIDEDRVVEFPDGDTGSPGNSGEPHEGAGDMRPDTAAAAAQLGVTEEALIAALGDPSRGAPNFAATAETLGITEAELTAALGGSPEERGMPPSRIADVISDPQEETGVPEEIPGDPQEQIGTPQPLDLAAASAQLGVTEDALSAALVIAATELGVTEQELIDALATPPSGADSKVETDSAPGVDDGEATSTGLTYPIVDTNQTVCYDDSGEIAFPAEGDAFYGQDAQVVGHDPSFTDNGDGTITDNVTGLVWQQSPDTDGDGDIDAADRMSYEDACAYCENLSYAGHDDWQLPTIKQLYSLMDFSGVDPSGFESTDISGLTPFINTEYFDFAYGDTEARERIIDSQYASSTLYGGGASENLLFGVNFADGRIKGYGLTLFGQDKTFSVLCVRENSSYGVNDFNDNGDGTITDHATGLMWSQDDSGDDAPEGLNWEQALAYVEAQNDISYLGYNDWRLPNVKELQSIVDYSRSPDVTDSAAIDPLFDVTSIINESGETDYAFYWSSTTHANWTDSPGSAGAYVSFGRAMGYMDGAWNDVHGAGAQRSDPKSGDPSEWPTGNGPQGDAIRIYNYVRLVRDVD